MSLSLNFEIIECHVMLVGFLYEWHYLLFFKEIKSPKNVLKKSKAFSSKETLFWNIPKKLSSTAFDSLMICLYNCGFILLMHLIKKIIYNRKIYLIKKKL